MCSINLLLVEFDNFTANEHPIFSLIAKLNITNDN